MRPKENHCGHSGRVTLPVGAASQEGLKLHHLKTPLPEFTFLNTTARPEGWNDARMEKLWLYNLHYMADCNEALMLRWIAGNPAGWGNGWEPYPISLRVVNWVKFLVGHQDLDEENREKIDESLRGQMRFLMPRLEYHLLANHLLANAKALVFAGTYFGGHAGRVILPEGGRYQQEQRREQTEARRWFEKGMAIYRKELPEQTCADGVNFELSPMYHCIILEDLLDCHRFTREPIFAEYAEKMIVGLKMVMGPDGKIAKFNDSTEGIARSPQFLLDFARRLGLEVDRKPAVCYSAKASGFVRQVAGNYTMLAKCGAIGPKYQPGHAHADTFSFELWRGTEKIVGDTGCSTYVPGAIRSYERSTAAHNTVVIDGENSSEVWAAHRVGRRFDFGRHRRRFELTQEGLKGMDEIFGRGKHRVEVRFHLPPGISSEQVTLQCAGARTVEPCDFAMGWNRREKGLCVTYRQTVELPTQFEWIVT